MTEWTAWDLDWSDHIEDNLERDHGPQEHLDDIEADRYERWLQRD